MTLTSRPAVPLCPICRKPAIAAHKPFCSPRCQQIDLGKWLNGSYRVESNETEDESEDE